MKMVKILGSGCANCKKLEAVAREAATSAGIEAEFVKVTDMKAIMDYDLLATPGLVINEKLVSSGRIRRRPRSGNGWAPDEGSASRNPDCSVTVCGKHGQHWVPSTVIGMHASVMHLQNRCTR